MELLHTLLTMPGHEIVTLLGYMTMVSLNYNLRFWFAKLNSWESIWDKYKCYQLRF